MTAVALPVALACHNESLYPVNGSQKRATADSVQPGSVLEGSIKPFGLCENGGEHIDEKRLEAIPWTRYCSAHEAQAATGPGPRRVTL